MTKKTATYFVSFVGEMIQNPEYDGYVAGRVEITPEDGRSAYPTEEVRYFTKCSKEWEKFADTYDFCSLDAAKLKRMKATIKSKFMNTAKETTPAKEE